MLKRLILFIALTSMAIAADYVPLFYNDGGYLDSFDTGDTLLTDSLSVSTTITTDSLNATTAISGATVYASSYVSAPTYYGDGSNLTGISGGSGSMHSSSSISDTDKDTYVKTEATSDEDIIRFGAAGNEVAAFYSSNTIFNDDNNNQYFQIKGPSEDYVFYYDYSLNNIGIFKDIPRARLHIGQGSVLIEDGRLAFGDTKLPATDDSAHIKYSESTNDLLQIRSLSNASASTSGTYSEIRFTNTNASPPDLSLSFIVSNTERMKITKAGNVGINADSNINARLEVGGAISASGAISATTMYASSYVSAPHVYGDGGELYGISVLDSQYVIKSGDTMTGQLQGDADGSVIIPSFSFSGDSDTGIWQGVGNANKFFFGAGQQLFMSISNSTQDELSINDDSNDIDFRVESDNDANALFVQGNTGNIGIGTNNPQAELYVSGNISTTSPGDIEVGGTLYVPLKMEHKSDNDTYMRFTDDSMNFVAGNVDFLQLIESTQDEFVVNQNGVDVDFRVEATGNANALKVVGSNGRVGINESNPQVELELHGSQIISETGGSALLRIKNDGTGNYSGINFDRERLSGVYTGGSIFMESDPSSGNALLYIQSQSAGGQAGNTAALTAGNGVRAILGLGIFDIDEGDFRVGSNAIYADESTTRVGIGTTPGVATLDVSGSISATGDVDFDGSTLFVDSSANRVGIGTNYPVAAFHVASSDATIPALSSDTIAAFTRTNTTTTNAEVSIIGGNNANVYLNLGEQSDEDQGYIQYNNQSNYMTIGTNKTYAVRIDSSQNVGIGDLSPVAKLSVSGSVSASGVADFADDVIVEGQLFAGGENLEQIRTIVSARAGARGEIYLRDLTSGYSTGSTTLDGTYLASDNGIFSIAGQNNAGSGTAAYFSIDQPNGRVGINTSSPTYMFEVTRANSGDTIAAVTNTDTTSTSDSILRMSNFSGAGDPYLLFTIGVSQGWSLGVDNSDSDAFEIGRGFLGPGSHDLKIDTSGNAFFAGDLDVGGALSKGSGSFKIDHPLDPANKNLKHSFIEGPEMTNFYDGKVTTRCRGSICSEKVTFPDWFVPLNGNNTEDYRYQLTSIGRCKEYWIDNETDIIQGFFVIKSIGECRLSWQVTGIRHDKHAIEHRIMVESEKTKEEKEEYKRKNP